MSKETGGPAFPHESYDYDTDMDRVNPGLTMRDYFAAQALTHVILSPTSSVETVVNAADHVYRVADAMLAARAKGGDADG